MDLPNLVLYSKCQLRSMVPDSEHGVPNRPSGHPGEVSDCLVRNIHTSSLMEVSL